MTVQKIAKDNGAGMRSWFIKKAQNARVTMYTKELKWELETAAPERRATILALASFLRVDAFNDDIPATVLDRPLDYSRGDLMRFFEMLEDIREASALKEKRLKKSGFPLPDFAVAHFKVSNRALEVWMCTIGAGIVPDRRDDVRQIWQHLAGALSSLPTAILRLHEIEAKTAEMTGASDRMFQGIDTNVWLDACRFVPSAFVSEFKL